MERLTVPEGDIAAVFALRSFGDRSELCTLLIKDVHAGQRRHSSFRLMRKGIEDPCSPESLDETGVGAPLYCGAGW